MQYEITLLINNSNNILTVTYIVGAGFSTQGCFIPKKLGTQKAAYN